ncbi:lytic transglycosylase domain-containing protein [Wohlfahrtiimonas chitiniclastica]|uniref:Murein lytic transglycosylase yjbJ n=1 Tax=Wohlfahrtiimonas chitiniclastica SH04 TaxID=1261130 RepID=L8XVQ4_9GAMM|nr:lytic transglycosylase domain-containing protein [Wohlfahrtiimonas chitiniclastica]ELV08108.1 Hypothetical protein F387_00347 [Wohlfahrtiimonas chitiniclastica SH04]KZS23030.1 hypothetical protein BMY_0870 [Wohlfahrtiimonas chitiniclastica]KZX37609.1 hypothetical protein A6V30_01610 [Wohlfahrtiimonas chitiniclastica]MBS7817586.1 lytic transglycosylase domain-containing protein [Wohlfahrtiimonas chitiniclastica]MBS7819348.1 lytic transglycosylase domain-containing protein [Wohlfahrtiimonas c
MIIKSILRASVLTLMPLVAHADIYSYLDEFGQTHYVNHPIEGGALVKRLSPIMEEDNAVEDVQQLLNAPRFSRTVTMVSDGSEFQGDFPRPRAFANHGIEAAGVNPILRPPPSLPTMKGRDSFAPYITMVARQYDLQPALLHAVITVESAYNPNAISHAGAKGLMQLMPAAAARFGVDDPYDPIQNMRGGAAYLRWLLDYFGDVSLALAGYNAGEGSVRKYGNKIPPYKETMNYVPKVLQYYQQYRAQGY